MPSFKTLLKSAAICAATMAVIYRVPQARKLVTGA